MNDLIQALTIFQLYLTNKNSRSPLNTSHDTLWIMEVDPEDVSPEHFIELQKLGFFCEDDAWCSHRFGSA